MFILLVWNSLLQVTSKVTRITTILKLRTFFCGSKQILELQKMRRHTFSFRSQRNKPIRLYVCVCVRACACMCVGKPVSLQIHVRKQIITCDNNHHISFENCHCIFEKTININEHRIKWVQFYGHVMSDLIFVYKNVVPEISIWLLCSIKTTC